MVDLLKTKEEHVVSKTKTKQNNAMHYIASSSGLRTNQSPVTYGTCWSCHAPHPHEPEASNAISVEGRSSGGDRNATPAFQEVMNSLHHSRSDRKPG